MNELALFAGAGGGILGGKLLGWRTVCAVERDAYAAQVLAQRQNDGHLEPFPIWSDVTSFDGKPWRGIAQVVSGGFPCQDISVAGKGAGITGARSGLWKEFARIIGEVRPRYAFIENSPALVTRGLGTVLCDLAAMGFDAEWGVISAADVGANHRRERLWIVAHTNSEQERRPAHETDSCGIRGASRLGVEVGGSRRAIGESGATLAHSGKERHKFTEHEIQAGRHAFIYGRQGMAYTDQTQRKGMQCACGSDQEHADISARSWWEAEPRLDRVANGLAHQVDRLAAIGNGQVPLCAATAWRVLTNG